MIIDWTKGAIQQVATTIGRRMWTWIGVSAAVGATVTTRYDLVGADVQKFSLIGIDDQNFELIGTSNKKFPLIGA